MRLAICGGSQSETRYLCTKLQEYCAQAGCPAEVCPFEGLGELWAAFRPGLFGGVLMGIGRKPLFTKSYIAPGKHPVKGLYGAIASLVCSGTSLQWFKNEFLPEDFQTMNMEAAKRRERTEELFFYPYLAGANYPIWNLRAKGAFTGLTLEHDRFDLARAVMEGVAFGARRGVMDFEANGCEIRKITMMGGASKSALWCQMLASITHRPVYKLNQADICALGAAMIAACGLGIYRDYTEAAAAMRWQRRGLILRQALNGALRRLQGRASPSRRISASTPITI